MAARSSFNSLGMIMLMKFKKWIRFGKQGNRKPVKHIYLYNVYAENEGPIIAFIF
jgi:hypothetical protein